MGTRLLERYELTMCELCWQTARVGPAVQNGQAPGFLVQDAGSGAKGTNGAAQMTLQLVDGKFRDSRWQEGRWVLDNFKDSSGSMDWDKVSI